MRRAYIDVPLPQEQIHCRHSGSSGPWIFLFHQFPLSCRQFERLIPCLGKFSRAYGLDAPGYGVSPAPPSGLTIAQYASRLIDAINAIGAKEFAVIGIETGVATAAEVIRQAGNKRIIGAIFLDAPPVDPEAQATFITQLGTPNSEQTGEHLIVEWNRFQKRWGANTDKPQLRMAVSETFYVYGRFNWGITAFSKYNLGSALSQISCPTIFMGAEHDKLNEHGKAAARLVKNAEHQIFSDSLPTLSWTVPEEVSRRIAEFLDQKR